MQREANIKPRTSVTEVGGDVFAGLGHGSIACLGECMIELVERPDGLLSRGYGGDTLNTAVYLARLGMAVRYVTALGDDQLSQAMLDGWALEGVDVSSVVRMHGRVPGLYMIKTDQRGERHFTYWRDSAPVRQLFDDSAAGATEAALATADVVYLSGITLSLFRPEARARLFAALAALRLRGKRIVFDSNFRTRGWPDTAEAKDAYHRMLGSSDVVLAGVEDFMMLGEAKSADALIAHLAPYELPELIVKLSEPGCIIMEAGHRRDVPVPAIVQPLDTTAAGDSFAAAYLAARLRGASPQKAAQSGHELARAVILHAGAIIPSDAMPDNEASLFSSLDP